ncbi:DUF2789 domain-containing protein [Acinetobacter qingfengensis]|uniref:Uncharacterized protein n=1 Tax=Acinetobacter qingfengensis TaxID=1262585 RepID=A0A1E7R9X8_9GAMM|nr:DUF2789 family protein [Acinetobacter qingfengensis]KAA8733942.1 DUF2789 domain-containing protein [Acinetobacter qingfengensis]OEY96189.1 hypothetical protein BJI46_12300 [Acinetobacter qingfengensis]
MNTVTPRMTHLFQQLGLDSSQLAIEEFIKNHQLDAQTYITDASFWNEAQCAFIKEKISADDNWATIVDQLNESLHEDSVKL